MKIAAMIGMKDELELLPAAIGHLFDIGVDTVIARDNGSTDGSLEYLRGRESKSLWVVPLSAEENADSKLWSEREAHLARSTDADWVIFLDADEFWLPQSGNLRDCEHFQDPTVDVLVVPRYNVPLPAGVSAPVVTVDQYPNLNLFIEAPAADLRLYLLQNPDKSWIAGVPAAKIAARRHRIGALHLGHHSMDSAEGQPLRRMQAIDLLITHFPFTSLPRFMRKVSNIRKRLDEHAGVFPGQAAWHWKRWAAMGDQELTTEFERQCFTPAELESLRESGRVRTAADVLRARGTRE
jgi:glycosyltransferase involved in cell wall biosynthesis